ncbi:retron system putative HNH endonuclease [Priestia megaterium]|uniref:retron system putative HNH endonuclease n=1 Tax=Priestia megaterium TaxID=1404 RepID=UPI0036DC61AE
MLNLRNKYVIFTAKEKKYLQTIDLATGESWEISTKDMKAIKTKIKEHLASAQSFKCAYCSSRLNVGGRAEIEHIAPKAKSLYPEFTFNGMNLVLACQHCNSSSKKGRKNPVSRHSKYYRKCKFSIVHPYFDDPSQHYNWTNGVRICIVANSPKAQTSIEMFELDSLYLTEQRAMDLQRERRKAKAQLSLIEEEEIDKALELLP